jgi:hypothetical protein
MKVLLKSIFSSIVITLLVSWVISTIVSNNIKRSSTEAVKENQIEIAQQTMDKIDRYLFERYNEIQAAAEDAEFEGFLAGRNKAQKSNAKLTELSILTGPWDVISLVDSKKETVVASTIESQAGEDITEERHNYLAFTEAIKGGRYHSDVVLSEDTGRPTIIFSAPIKDDEATGNPVVGAIIGHISWPAVLEILQSTKENAIELYNTEKIKIGDNLPQTSEEILSGNTSTNDSLQTVKGSFGSTLTSDGKTLTSFVTEKGFLTYKGNNWILLLETPVSEAFLTSNQTAVSASTVIIIGFIFNTSAIVLICMLLTRSSRVIPNPTQTITVQQSMPSAQASGTQVKE